MSRVAAESFVVNFKIGHRAARLASPAIALQHLLAKLFVRFRIKPQRATLWAD
jgi:hypothetical protein